MTSADGARLSVQLSAALERGAGQRAVEFAGEWLTWTPFARAAASYITLAAQHGVPPGARVVLVGANSPRHLALLLSLLAGRATLVMVNGHQSSEQIVRDVVAANPDVIVSTDWTGGLRDAAADVGALGVAIEEGAGGFALTASIPWAGAKACPRDPDLAVEMLTSGTTGPPKRIPIRYPGLASALEAARRIDLATAGGEFPAARLASGSIVHIGGFVNVCSLALRGEPMLLREKFTVASWRKAVADYGVTQATLAPAMIRMIMDSDVRRDEVQSLKAIRTGSAPITDETKQAFEDRLGVPVLGAYGATEYCGTIAFWSLEEHRRFKGAKPGAVGRIMRDVADVRIVGLDGRESPPGETGALQARVFRMGSSWIRTNDLATVDSDDFLYIRGRSDRVINRGGFKVSPEVIEEELRAHPAVGDAAVIARPDARLGEAPVAGVELKTGADANAAELLAFLRERLVAYHVPAHLVVLPALPRTPSMKVARQLLKELIDDDIG